MRTSARHNFSDALAAGIRPADLKNEYQPVPEKYLLWYWVLTAAASASAVILDPSSV
jgi:hypothetical protein